MKVILEYDGSVADFENEICKMDDSFDFYDSLFYELDYGDKQGSYHKNIKITKED